MIPIIKPFKELKTLENDNERLAFRLFYNFEIYFFKAIVKSEQICYYKYRNHSYYKYDWS